MRSFSYSKPRFDGLSVYFREAKLGKADLNMGWMLLRLIGWLATAALVVGLIWHITADAPLASQAFAGVLLVTIGLLAGLRIGSYSATGYIKDVQRLNKVLAGQNSELETANAILLKELSTTAEPASRSQSA